MCPGSAQGTSPNTLSHCSAKPFSSNTLQLYKRMAYCSEMSSKIIMRLEIKVQDTVYNRSYFLRKKWGKNILINKCARLCRDRVLLSSGEGHWGLGDKTHCTVSLACRFDTICIYYGVKINKTKLSNLEHPWGGYPQPSPYKGSVWAVQGQPP